MRFSARLQLLTCLMLYASSAQAIMVKFGTSGGPIVPPTPEPATSPQPYRNPAPVWEERSNDTPDPNANWRPAFFLPQSRYTNVIFSSPSPSPPLNNAQRFANSYKPTSPSSSAQPIPSSQPTQGIKSAILGSQSLPGIGLRYFYPAYQPEQKTRQEDAPINQLEGNGLFAAAGADSASDFQWKYEKDATRRNIRNSREGTHKVPVYQFPVYVPPRHHLSY